MTQWEPRYAKALEVSVGEVVGRLNTVWQIDNGTNALRLITGWIEVFK